MDIFDRSLNYCSVSNRPEAHEVFGWNRVGFHTDSYNKQYKAPDPDLSLTIRNNLTNMLFNSDQQIFFLPIKCLKAIWLCVVTGSH